MVVPEAFERNDMVHEAIQCLVSSMFSMLPSEV